MTNLPPSWSTASSSLFFSFSGNIDRLEAESMGQYLENEFFLGPHRMSLPIFPSQYLTRRVTKLEKATPYFFPAQGLNPSDENSALIHYIQVILSANVQESQPKNSANSGMTGLT